MATRNIVPLPPELTRLLFTLGERKLVLVEGPTDVDVFKEWYRDRLSQIAFYPAEGHPNVESFLNEILAKSVTRRAYGIIDRDFRDEAEVNAALADPGGHLFILYRYAIENYLLEPAAVLEELRQYHGTGLAVDDEAIMAQSLLDICRWLKPVMAANWVFWEKDVAQGSSRVESFGEGFPADDRPLLIRETARRLGCSEEEAERRVVEKEARIDAALGQLESAYARINGKHILERLFKTYQIHTTKDHFRRLLARTVKTQLGVHDHIRAIVNRRILGEDLAGDTGQFGVH
jgi:hypothetical protein